MTCSGGGSPGQRRWWAPDVAVPRHAGTQGAEVERAGSPARSPIELTLVPREERVVLAEPWVAVPGASSTFTAPADGVVVASCDAIDATPLQELHLAPMHPRTYYDAMQYGIPLLGVLLIVGGIALAVVTAVRRPRTRS